MFEFMISMGYDAMGIGNHEFDYGEASLAWHKNRVPFPVLGANLFYKDTGVFIKEVCTKYGERNSVFMPGQ